MEFRLLLTEVKITTGSYATMLMYSRQEEVEFPTQEKSCYTGVNELHSIGIILKL